MTSFDAERRPAHDGRPVRRLRESTLRPANREFERPARRPGGVRKAATSWGSASSLCPKRRGPGLGVTTAVLLEEEMRWGDPAAGVRVRRSGRVRLGGPRARHARAGTCGARSRSSATDGMRASAPSRGARRSRTPSAPASRPRRRGGRDGWRLDGAKAYVVNADRADASSSSRRSTPAAGWRGLGAFVVEKDTTG